MYIKQLQVYNYKSYLDSGLMEFTPGINIIVGRNNAGKTSLLEVLTLNFKDHPHKSLKTLPTNNSTIKDKKSLVEIVWYIDTKYILNCIEYFYPNVGIPAPKKVSYINELMDSEPVDPKDLFLEYMNEAFKQFKNKLENQNSIEIKLSIHSNTQIDDIALRKLLNFESYEVEYNINYFYRIEYNKIEGISLSFDIIEQEGDEDIVNLVQYKGGIDKSIGYRIFTVFLNRIYRFKAERLNLGSCRFENCYELKPDASNLAEVICILQGKNPGKFARFNQLVSDILEGVKWISVLPREDQNVEIVVWNTDDLSRDNLSIPLSLCGSGISQVLAIVYILVSSDKPRTIIIDEPQSFLHPGAARKLIEVIKQFPLHQYFIATHSPEIISTANPSNITKLNYQDCQTKASVIDASEIKVQKEILQELGVRLSDIFGFDNILWVEGETEEKCYPLILERIAQEPLMGIKVLPVGSPDALLDGKLADRVADIYRRLTLGAGLFPPAIGFLFDREDKPNDRIKVLEAKGFTFLKRPMYENYILNPEAIAAIINEEVNKFKIDIDNVTVIQVQDSLDRIKKEKKYLMKNVKEKDVSEENWLYSIHGTDVIEVLFQEFCGGTLNFKSNKAKYSYKITEWLIENKPNFLSELAEELKICLNKSSKK